MLLVDGVRLACTLHLKSINSNFLIFLVSFFNEIITIIIPSIIISIGNQRDHFPITH